jgi:hypothetical protein
MDNNNPQNPNPPAPETPAAAPSIPQVDPNAASVSPAASADPGAAGTVPPAPMQGDPTNVVPAGTDAPKKSNMMMFIIVAVILLLLIAGVVAYMMLGAGKSPTTDQGSQNVATSNEAKELEDELNQINVEEDVNQDFTDVDSELKQL